MNTRTDLSKYMIHSVRRPSAQDYPSDQEDELNYFPLLSGESLEDEFEVLKNIIREGGLRASLSYRNGRATVYGNTPVVCFTEMPLINFLQYVKKRNRRTRFTEYGIALLKNEVYKNGGRPVISGLSVGNEFEYLDSSKRIIKPEILPFSEQYRYVKLDIYTDWTHEREWRIACDSNQNILTVLDDYRNDIFETCGLNIFSDMFYSEAVIIIKTEDEAERIAKIVRDQLDSGYAKGGEEFYIVIRYLIVDKAVEFMETANINSIEELPTDAFYTQVEATLTDAEKDKVRAALQKCSEASIQFANEFFKEYNLDTVEKQVNFDLAGYAVVCSYDSDNKFYRYLLRENYGSAVSGSLWLNNLNHNAPHLQSIIYQEYLCKKQSEILNNELDDIFTVYSKLD